MAEIGGSYPFLGDWRTSAIHPLRPISARYRMGRSRPKAVARAVSRPGALLPRSGRSRSRSSIGIMQTPIDVSQAGAERANALDPGNGKMKLPQAGGCLCGKIRY